MLKKVIAATATFATILLPASASALTLLQTLGVFHLFIGGFLVAVFLVFSVGVYSYFARFNTWPSYRDASITIMEWGLVMLFVLIILLAIVQFFQKHPGVALPLLAFAVLIAVAVFVVRFAASAKKKEKKKEGPPKR